MKQLDIIKEANRVLKQYKAVDKWIVNVSKIIAKIGYSVRLLPDEENYVNISGAISSKYKTIYLNKTDSQEEQSFVRGHELGHYFLDHLSNGNNNEIIDKKRNKENKKEMSFELREQEEDADFFAGFLLMPISLMDKYFSVSKGNIYQTADFLGVPYEACRKQIEILKLLGIM